MVVSLMAEIEFSIKFSIEFMLLFTSARESQIPGKLFIYLEQYYLAEQDS